MAKEFRVSTATVYQLTAKAKRKPAFMEELFSKRDAKQQKHQLVSLVVQDMVLIVFYHVLDHQKHQLVSLVVQDMVENDEFIDSCKTVTDKVNQPKEANMQSQQEQVDENDVIAQG